MSESAIKSCSDCGAPLEVGWPKGLCHRCAFDRALSITHRPTQVCQAAGSVGGESFPPSAQPGAAPLECFGDYELLEEIARGGMGVVYRARQKSLGRIVALKRVLAGPFASSEFIKRFRTEVSVAATLQHPNIVAIHEVGVHDGSHYFSMDFVAGPTLAQVVARERLSPRKAARYVAIIAEAIHYAHQHGILHRDLKPSNVLIDSETDQPRVTDFGLAKRLDLESSLTVTGQVLGSPNFIPPEQAGVVRGKTGRASDIYGLGGILYCLLTARAPFQADSLEHLLTQVLHAEPVAPRLLDPSIPRDLETIVLKCLEKEPARRYQTAQEVAQELNRFLNQEPIRARPLSTPAKVWRWCRRKPVLASLLLLLHVVGAAGLTGILWQWQRAEHHAASERDQRELGERQLYMANMQLAQRQWEQNRVSRVRELLEETAASSERNFEWLYWQRQLHRELMEFREHTGPILAVAFLPDGKRVVTASADRTAKVWHAETGTRLFNLKGHSAPIRALAISGDGQHILTGSFDGTARLWDANTGNYIRAFEGHRRGILSVAFSPDGHRIATASQDDTAIVWEVVTGKVLATFNGHSNRVWAVAFSPDGQRVLSGGEDHVARIWDAATGKELGMFVGHRGPVFSVAFSPDSGRIATGSRDHTVRVWDVATKTSVQILRGHTAAVFSVTYSRDGSRIITGSEDQTARLWSATDGEELAPFKGHGSPVSSAALSPDGTQLVTGGGAVLPSAGSFYIGFSVGDQRTAKLWDAVRAKEEVTMTGHNAEVVSLDVSADGRAVVSVSLDGTVRVWDVLTAKEGINFQGGHGRPLRAGAFTPDRRRVVVGGFEGPATVWEVSSKTLLYNLEGHSGVIFSVAVSPDGRWIATGSWDRTVRVWKADTGRLATVFDKHSASVFPVAFSPDSRLIVSGDDAGVGKVWEPATGRQVFEFQDIAKIWSAAFSADGRLIVTGNHHHTATLWDAATGRRIRTFRGHTSQIHAAAFSPDGRRIATGSADETARLWDVATGKELLTLKGHQGSIFAISFSPDGQRILTSSGDHTIKIWEAASIDQVADWHRQEQSIARARLREPGLAVRKKEGTPEHGGINKWLVLPPCIADVHSGVDLLLTQQIAPEAQLRPRKGDKVRIGSRDLLWREVGLEDFVLDFHQIQGGQCEWAVAYAVCYIHSDTLQTNLLLHVGSDDQAKVYVNGLEVYRSIAAEGWIPDRDIVSGIELKPGLNVLIFKVVNERGGWRGSIRITDAAANPVPGLRVMSTPP